MPINNGRDKSIVIYSHNEMRPGTKGNRLQVHTIAWMNLMTSGQAKSNNSYSMIPFTQNFKTQAKLIYIIRDRYNNGKNIKKQKSDNWKSQIDGKVLCLALQVILTVKIAF